MSEEDKAKEQLALFEHWSQGKFDFSASEKDINLYAEIYPAYDQSWAEMREISQRAGDRKCRFYHLQLIGPKTKEDFLFMWNYQTSEKFRSGFKNE